MIPYIIPFLFPDAPRLCNAFFCKFSDTVDNFPDKLLQAENLSLFFAISTELHVLRQKWGIPSVGA